jgi:molybdopterin-containing oxidoreductase family iron-sulfur binding subunit
VHDVLASAGEGFAAGLRVRFFGDFNDPESEVSRLLRERAHKQLLPERGTNPSVYYLV